MMNIYIGNFSYDITGDDLTQVFSAYGHVASAKVIRDAYSGNSRGFGFVEMPNTKEANAALLGIEEIKGRKIVIHEALPQEHKPHSKRAEPRHKNFKRNAKRY